MGNLWQIAVVVVLVAVLLPAANFAYAEQATTTTVQEEIQVDHGASTSVATNAAVYGDNVTITTSGGNTLEADSDYRWDAAFGSVYWPENSDAPDGETVDIEYRYSESDDTTDGIATIIGSVGWLMWAVVLLTIIATLVAWLGFGRGGGY
jgi:hypothetical protein